MKKIKISTIIYFLIYLAMLIFFAYECFQDGSSASKQAGFVARIVAKILGFLKQEEVIIDDQFKFYVSKLIGHYTYFVILGTFSILFYMSIDKIKDYIRIILHFSIGFIYAFSTEFIAEAMTSGRTATFTDVLIDFAGLSTVAIPYVIIYYLLKRKKTNQK